VLVLVLFAFLAGIATIFAPCILPILPVVLSAGLSGGKKRPLGIVIGLVASFTFFTLSLSYLTSRIGLDADVLRNVAIVVLILFGLLLMIPSLLAKFEVWVSQKLPQVQVGVGSERNDFAGGLLIGVSLGLVWTPCVGPIVASVITLSATSGVTAGSVFITAAYALGTSIPLLVITYGGKKLLARVRVFSRMTPKLQIVFGAVMVLTAVSMLFGYDRTLQATLLSKLPSRISSGLTQSLEQSDIVQSRLKRVGNSGETMLESTQIVGGEVKGLPVLGTPPDFTGITTWLNSDPLTLEKLKGKVVLVDFWTYSCINCIRTLPYITQWYDTYKDQGFVVVGVHAPEFAFEKKTENVQAAIRQYKINYPVAQDNDFATWKAYRNQYWPAHYLIDASGKVRATHFGEGKYEETEMQIRSLLKEASTTALPTPLPAVIEGERNQQTPETYLGSSRRERYAGFGETSLKQNYWSLAGGWEVSTDSITSTVAGDSISLNFRGSDVYLVLNPPTTGAGSVAITLNGRSITAPEAGADVVDGKVEVTSDRLYHLVDLATPSSGNVLTLTVSTPGTEAFAFTFN
jgi:cytochrome c biogenesis protein CcdA/thiol-disulfide isomerase/thioredoxin